MPIQYVIPCTATLTANASAFTEFTASCTEDASRGAETMIQRVYPIKIITVLFSTTPTPDVIVRIYKEDASGLIRPLSDSLPASLITRLISVSGQLPKVFHIFGEPAIILVNPMEKLIVRVAPLSNVGSSNVPVNFTLVAEKG
jgi:hypothetical protein